MASYVASVHRTINTLLPFTKPGTPILQDIVHTFAICALLYILPQLAEWQQRRRKAAQHQGPNTAHEWATQEDDNADGDVPQPGPEHVVNPQLNGEPVVDGLPQDDAQQEWQPDETPAPVADAPPPQAGLQDPQLRRARDQANVGTKKAKSLARREQRRAYHEFVRNQADQQRAADASTADAREAALSVEKQRRAEAKRRFDEQRNNERKSAKAEREERERIERERRLTCEKIIKERLREENAIDLMEVAEELFIDDVFAMKLDDEEADKVWQEKLVWVERLARAVPGLLGKREVEGDLAMTMITASGWIVRVDQAVMDAAYKKAELLARDRVKVTGEGRIGMKDFGHVLEDVLMIAANG